MDYLKLFWTFFKIGCTAFGGFMALISVVQSEIVEKLKLLDESDLLEGISIASILPGPMAVNVVSFAGYRIKGIGGSIACTIGVVMPSFFLMLLLAYLYYAYEHTTAIDSFFKGVLPAVVAVIIGVVLKLAKKNLVLKYDIILAVFACIILSFFKGYFSTLLLILVSGIIGAFVLHNKYLESGLVNKITIEKQELKSPFSLIIFLGSVAIFVLVFCLLAPEVYTELFLLFGKMGISLFGGGYVFIPMMEDVIVNDKGWMSAKEFADGIALGQVTPGPILISATFIGYKVKGVLGAIVASVGMFMPPAILILLATLSLDSIKQQVRLQSALRAIKSSVVGMIFIAAFIIGKSIEWDLLMMMILTTSFIALYFFRISVLYIIPTAGLITLLIFNVLITN